MGKIRTHYDNLKVARDAPAEVIRAAYRSLSQKYHPDRNPGDDNCERVMKLLNEAYQVLSDEQLRRQHDLWIAQEEEQEHPSPKATTQGREEEAPRWGMQVCNIDGWITVKVRQLQQKVASIIGITTIFQDPPFLLESAGAFLGFGSGPKRVECPEMVVIPPGKLMDHLEITQPFAIGRYAVTNTEYWTFCRLTNRNVLQKSFLHPDWPVRFVSWWDASQYCDWLSSMTGKAYRLPSKIEWEYACRAGTRCRYWFGDRVALDDACFGGHYCTLVELKRLRAKVGEPDIEVGADYAPARFRLSDYAQKPVNVAKFRPNPWGCFQMHGNVSEWVSDAIDSRKRVAYGGSFMSLEEGLTASSYIEVDSGSSKKEVGFRVARSL